MFLTSKYHSLQGFFLSFFCTWKLFSRRTTQYFWKLFNVSITSTSVYQSIYSFIVKLILNEPLSFDSYFIVLGWLRPCKSRPSVVILKMKINQDDNKWTHSCILYNTHLKVIFQHSISLWKCLFSKGNTVLKKYLNGNHLSWFFWCKTWKIQVE